jgi:hypothetical protein
VVLPNEANYDRLLSTLTEFKAKGKKHVRKLTTETDEPMSLSAETGKRKETR